MAISSVDICNILNVPLFSETKNPVYVVNKDKMERINLLNSIYEFLRVPKQLNPLATVVKLNEAWT